MDSGEKWYIPKMSISTMEKLRSGVFDPIRRLCDSQQFQFLIILQNSTCPNQRYWASSQQLNHFLGNWIAEVATRIEAEEDTKVFHEDWDEYHSPLSNIRIPEGPPSPSQVVDGEEELLGTWIADIADHLTINGLTNTEDTTSHDIGLPNASSTLSPSFPIQDSINKKRLKSNSDDEVAKDHVGIGGKRHKPNELDGSSGAEGGGSDDRGSSDSASEVVKDTNDCVLMMPDGEEVEEDEEIDDALEMVSENWTMRQLNEPPKLITCPVQRLDEFDMIPHVGGAFQHLRDSVWDEARPLRKDDPTMQYLDDDLDTDAHSSSTGIPHCQSDLAPVVWKSHLFDRPLRPSLVKSLLEDKVFFSHRINRYHVSDAEYAKTCLKILRKRNPYCIFRPKNLCRFLKEKDMFQAEFVCLYHTCQLEAYLCITCGDNMVSIEFFENKDVKKRHANTAVRDTSENPFITFTPHKNQDHSLTTEPITVLKKNNLQGVLAPNQLKDGFVSKLVLDENLKKQVIPSPEYLGLLKPLLARLNPFCHFEKVVTPCTPLANKNKKKLTFQKFSVQLACSENNCNNFVTVKVSNPSGNVELKFSKRGRPGPTAASILAEDLEECITLDHRGKVLLAEDSLIVEPNVQNEKSNDKVLLQCNEERGSEDSSTDRLNVPLPGSRTDILEDSTYFLKIPSPIMHDEKIPKSVLKEVFLDKLTVGKTPEGRVREQNTYPSHLSDSSYIPIIRPIVNKYNPNCSLRSANTKCLTKSRAVKCVFQCKRKDCDFLADCRVHRDTGEVLIYMRNRLALTCNPYAQGFCYIRHEKDVSWHYFRKPEREKLYQLPPAALKQMFGQGSRVGKEIRYEARKWHRRQAEIRLHCHEDQGALDREPVKPSDEERTTNELASPGITQDSARSKTGDLKGQAESTEPASHDHDIPRESDIAVSENADLEDGADRNSLVTNSGPTSSELDAVNQPPILAPPETFTIPRTVRHHTIPSPSLRYFTELMDPGSAEEAQEDNSPVPTPEILDEPSTIEGSPAYIGLLHHLLGEANPYCQWQPEVQAFYDASSKQYKALFYCVHDSCDVMAWCHVHSVSGSVLLRFWNQGDDGGSEASIVLDSDEEDEGVEEKSVVVNHPRLKPTKKPPVHFQRTSARETSATEKTAVVAQKPLPLKTYSRLPTT